MAKSVEAFTWKNGFRQPSSTVPWAAGERNGHDPNECRHYSCNPPQEVETSTVHNALGLNTLRTWPDIYDGTNSASSLPSWWKPKEEVDVLICGAGPSGLQLAVSLIRQGVSFRIIDAAPTPLIAGRADGVQPRFLETLHTWGLAQEVHEEGPLIERTAIYKDGKKLWFSRSHLSDSRYRGLHIITQGQLERIYIRDLLRHQALVERSTSISEFSVHKDNIESHPVQATIRNERSGVEDTVRAKFLVGSDGAASCIRKSVGIPFDGVSTDIYWGIMDCVFETDYPHAWVFGSVVSSKHGGCVIIPREDGYIRLYTQLDTTNTGDIALARQASDPTFKESGGRVDTNSITADEILVQANKIFAPYTLKFAAPLSWFAVWKISERVARSFSSPDLRIHLVGDAAHVHSVMGAFGLNGSIMDAANLAWKLGLCSLGLAPIFPLLSTYSLERRAHAARIIRVSGSYLRFVCNSTLPVVKNLGDDIEMPNDDGPKYDPTSSTHTPEDDLAFLKHFFATNGQFLLGLDATYGTSVLTPSALQGSPSETRAIGPLNGVRAPNPRICFSLDRTGYLYDMITGASTIHVIFFVSTLTESIRKALQALSATLQDPVSWYCKFGGKDRFNIVLVTKLIPFELSMCLDKALDLEWLRDNARWVYDDRAPDEDAHTWYEVNRSKGAVVVVRPDLWVGTSAFLEDVEELGTYFDQFLLPMAGTQAYYQPRTTTGGVTVKPDAVIHKDAMLNGHKKISRTPEPTKTTKENPWLDRDSRSKEDQQSRDGHSNGLISLMGDMSSNDSTPKPDIRNEHAASDEELVEWDTPSLKNLMGISESANIRT